MGHRRSTRADGVAVVLSNYLDGSAADIAAVRELLAKGALGGVHFRSDDLDGLFDRLKAGVPRCSSRRPTSSGVSGTARCGTLRQRGQDRSGLSASSSAARLRRADTSRSEVVAL